MSRIFLLFLEYVPGMADKMLAGLYFVHVYVAVFFPVYELGGSWGGGVI